MQYMNKAERYNSQYTVKPVFEDMQKLVDYTFWPIEFLQIRQKLVRILSPHFHQKVLRAVVNNTDISPSHRQ